MDLIEQLKADLDNGYTKSDLERLIGLPQNSLSKVIKTGVGLSKKSEIKIQNWMVSIKPDPLNVFYKPKENKPNKEEITPEPKKQKKEVKSTMPDPKDKVAYLKWLRGN